MQEVVKGFCGQMCWGIFLPVSPWIIIRYILVSKALISLAEEFLKCLFCSINQVSPSSLSTESQPRFFFFFPLQKSLGTAGIVWETGISDVHLFYLISLSILGQGGS